jgi:F-type H+-transporting ATPase subunit delta
MRQRPELYADAFYAVIVAEGNLNEIQAELFAFAQAVEGNDELSTTLSDPHLPAHRRQQIVEDLLGGQAFDATIALISMVVAAGRAHDLPTIVRHLQEKTASMTDRSVAEVRTAVPLSDEEKQRMIAALKKATGHDVDLVVVIDPTVLGGVVAQIGDTVIDGTVRHRLGRLKESF